MKHNTKHSQKRLKNSASDQRGRRRSKKKSPKNKQDQPIKVKVRDEERKYAKRNMKEDLNEVVHVCETTESLFNFQPNPLLAPPQTAHGPLQLKLDISALLRDCSDRVAWKMIHGEDFSSASVVVGSPRVKCH